MQATTVSQDRCHLLFATTHHHHLPCLTFVTMNSVAVFPRSSAIAPC
uniref:Uncharacterized protein n=1 Tax=Arundo donax TaxID=35708 RepID=A0A0A9AKB1_ARUDO